MVKRTLTFTATTSVMLLANKGFRDFGDVISAQSANSAWDLKSDPKGTNRNIYSPIEPNVTFTIETTIPPNILVNKLNSYNEGASISNVQFGGIVATPDGTFKKPT